MKKLKKEKLENSPLGKLVKVNGKNIHIYAEGEGKNTIVFLAGHGTNCPTLDFKILWEKMLDDYRIVVVERSGYGWSDISNNPKDIDSLLEETRKSLNLAGETGPFILFPHSMSGLESIYWAQKHPNEIKAIIGLDACVPETYDILPKENKAKLLFTYVISRIGMSRFMPGSDLKKYFPILKSSILNDEEKNKYIKIFYKNSFSKDMLRETKYMKKNSKKIRELNPPVNTPMLFFISKKQDSSIKNWGKVIIDYLSKIPKSKYYYLDTDHYVHYHKSDIIVEKSKSFLKK
ncbi:MAG: alpha/beta fold hydrolase [Thermotogota bacterium]